MNRREFLKYTAMATVAAATQSRSGKLLAAPGNPVPPCAVPRQRP